MPSIVPQQEPEDKTPAADDKAAVIAQQLEAEIADAKADVRADAANEEQKKIDQERLENLERRLAEVERRGYTEPVTSAVPEAPAAPAAPAADDGKLDALTEKVEDLAEQLAAPVEGVAEAATDAAEEAEEVVEELPRRTHGMFRKLWGGHN